MNHSLTQLAKNKNFEGLREKTNEALLNYPDNSFDTVRFLNIVKNLVDLHNASIKASNRPNQKGASMKIIFPRA